MKYCWDCEKQVETTTEMKEVEYNVKGTQVKATIPTLICNECKAEMYELQNEMEVDKIVLAEARKLGVDV